jgi:hypothetical protein
MQRRTPPRARRAAVITTASLTAAFLLVAAACGPEPSAPPPTPSWHATRLPLVAGPTGRVDHVGAWTNEEWFATVRSTTTGGATSSELVVAPRTGPGGGQLGTAQVLPLPDSGYSAPIGERTLAVPRADAVLFFVEEGGVWTEAGSVAVDWEHQAIAITDDWLVVRRQMGFEGDGEVRLYRIERSGTTVAATLEQTLEPDPAWTPEQRNRFGLNVALDGGVLVVLVGGGSDGGPLLQVHRLGPDGWTPTQTLGDGSGVLTTSALAVDDGPTVDRIVTGAVVSEPSPPAVDVWADTGSGFAIEQRIEADPSLPDEGMTASFGAAVGLDGDVLAVSSRSTLTPSAEPGHADVQVGQVQVYRHAGTWAPEAELAPYPDPFDAGIQAVLPHRLQVVGNHVVATAFVVLDPPEPCPWPCLALGSEAWTASWY